ncbi:MAG TPA: pirin family protein [Candidatus Paceibacterota bacterium]|nr:pirin family protein [Candidatus Paceibacterota bacterium]
MKTTIHRADERGGGEHGWLSTRYSFSFADWYEPSRMGFGALRVINDDRIAGKSGFGAHAHADMEIITIVLSGTLTHKDSMGNTGTIRAGEVQVMSAGTGVVHAEFNDADEELTLFQLWILPDGKGHEPRYAQQDFGNESKETLLVAPLGHEEVLCIHQDAYITRLSLAANEAYEYRMQKEGNGLYVLVVEGEIGVAGETLGKRDAIGIEDVEAVALKAVSGAELLLIEVPV